jgi:GAF domain-containing protein
MGKPAIADRRADGTHAAEADYREVIHAFNEVACTNVGELDELLHLIARKMCELLKVSRASVYLKDGEGCYRGQVGHDTADIDARVKRLVAGGEGDRFTREIIASRRPVAVTNVLRDPRPMRATMREWGVVSMLGVPMIAHEEVIGILFFDDVDHPRVFSAWACEIGLAFAELAAGAVERAQAGMRLRAGAKAVVRQNQQLRRAAELDERLNTIAADGAGVRGIVGELGEMLGRPVAFHDENGARRALALPAGEELEPRLLNSGYREHPAVEEALAALNGRGATLVGPIPQAGIARRHLLVPVIGGGRCLGRLVVLETGARLGALETHICSRAASVLAMQLTAEDFAVGAGDIGSKLARDLVEGSGDAAGLRRRGELLGIDLEGPHVLCLIAARDGGELVPGSREAVAEALTELHGNAPALVSELDGGIAAILPVDGGRVARVVLDELERELERVLDRLRDNAGGLAVALSGVVGESAGYARAGTEAGQVLRCLQLIGEAGGPWLLSALELGAGRLMLSATEKGEAQAFARAALGPLLEESHHMADLLLTLQVFFECARGVRSSAAALSVHENTIRYRLARVEELTGLDVAADSADQLTVQIALLVLQLQGRGPWRVIQVPELPGPGPERSVFQESSTSGEEWKRIPASVPPSTRRSQPVT